MSFAVSEFGLKLDVEKTMALLTVIVSPFLIYIGAESYSERDAKRVIEESSARKDITNQILNDIESKINKDRSNEI